MWYAACIVEDASQWSNFNTQLIQRNIQVINRGDWSGTIKGEDTEANAGGR